MKPLQTVYGLVACKVVMVVAKLASQFGIMSNPTLVVFVYGKIVNQTMGAKPKDEILAML